MDDLLAIRVDHRVLDLATEDDPQLVSPVANPDQDLAAQ
jgi:hypothetical protein